MKKRVLAVLLAVCMIVGTCVLFASAETVKFEVGTYVVTKDGSAITDQTTIDKLKVADEPTDVKITAKENPSLSGTVKDIDASTVESLCDFEPKFSTVKGDVKVSGTVTDTTATVTVKSETTFTVYKVLKTIEGEGTDKISSKISIKDDLSTEEWYKYTINGKGKYSDNITVSNIKKTERLNTLTMGVRFYGSNYENLNALEIAEVKATYKNLNKDTIYVYNDTIKDLLDGTEVVLSTQLKDPKFAEFYKFSYWVDGSGNILKKANYNVNPADTSYTWTAGPDANIYAVYTELKGRIRINFSSKGEGNIGYEEEVAGANKVINREIAKGTGQISVMEGTNVTFYFSPKEGFEVGHVYVDRTGTGKKVDVASFLTVINASDLKGALSELVSATGADRAMGSKNVVSSFTFTAKDLQDAQAGGIRSIDVEFLPIAKLEAPSGKELPTVEPEGITLAMGAGPDPAAAAAAAGGDAAATTLPAEAGAAAVVGSTPLSGVVNPATGSTGAIAVFAVLSLAAGAAFVTAKKKED